MNSWVGLGWVGLRWGAGGVEIAMVLEFCSLIVHTICLKLCWLYTLCVCVCVICFELLVANVSYHSVLLVLTNTIRTVRCRMNVNDQIRLDIIGIANPNANAIAPFSSPTARPLLS
jgi:hypothetical protein